VVGVDEIPEGGAFVAVLAVVAGVDEALALGIRGTPMSYISVAGNMLPVEGSQPISALRSAINAILEELNRTSAPSGTTQ